MDKELKTKRLVVMIEPSRYGQIEAVSHYAEFRVNGQPSSAEVVRVALDLFFAYHVHKYGQTGLYTDENHLSELPPSTASAPGRGSTAPMPDPNDPHPDDPDVGPAAEPEEHP